jgi:hypothetical protein
MRTAAQSIKTHAPYLKSLAENAKFLSDKLFDYRDASHDRVKQYVCMSVDLSSCVWLSVCLYVYLYVRLFVCLSVCLCMSLFLSVRLPLSIFVYVLRACVSVSCSFAQVSCLKEISVTFDV